jgi:hypothetical protein
LIRQFELLFAGAASSSSSGSGGGAGASVTADTVLDATGTRLAVSLTAGQYFVQVAASVTVVGGSGSDGFLLDDGNDGTIVVTGDLSFIGGDLAAVAGYAAPVPGPYAFSGTDVTVTLGGFINVTTAGEFGITLKTQGAPGVTTALAGCGIFVSPLTSTSSTSSVAGVSSVTASSPLASSGGTTPDISLTGVIGVANGGTGTSTAFTQGSVVFAGPAGVYAQDNANLFWDDTDNQLGIGGSPSHKLDVQAGTIPTTTHAMRVTGTLAATATTEIGELHTITNSLGNRTTVGQYVQLVGVGNSTAEVAAAVVQNSATGSTTANAWGNNGANHGFLAQTDGAGTAQNVAAFGNALSSTVLNAGSWGAAVTDTVGENIGAVGIAQNATGTHVGVVARITDATLLNPTLVSAALLATNGATADPIFVARDNNTTVFSVLDGGDVELASTIKKYNNSAPANGEVLIGDGTKFTKTTLTAGANITITNGAGTITIAASGGGGTYGGADVTFAVNDYSKTLTIVDAGVGAGSDIVVSVAKAAGRDADEFELSPVHAQVDTVTAGVGFTVFVVCPTGAAHGAFTIKYTRD